MGLFSNTCLDHPLNSVLICSCLLHPLCGGVPAAFLYVLEMEKTQRTYWADYFSCTYLPEWSWPKMWMYWRISSLWSFLAYWKMVICKENYSRILVYWEGRVKTTSALIAKEDCFLWSAQQGLLLWRVSCERGKSVCLCACVYTHVCVWRWE